MATWPLLDRAFEVGFAVHEYQPGEAASLGDVELRFELLTHFTSPDRAEHAWRRERASGEFPEAR